LFTGLHKTYKPEFIVAGLGNPQKKYIYTRHNAGFLFLSAFAGRFNIKIKKKQFNAVTGYGHIEGHDILLMMPLTFMNLSGVSVRAAMKNYRLMPDNLIVVHDDMDIESGRVKFQYMRSSAGHKGIESIIEKTGSNAFYRIRIGVGKPAGPEDCADYVLSEFTRGEISMLSDIFDKVTDSLTLFINGERQKAMESVSSIKGHNGI